MLNPVSHSRNEINPLVISRPKSISIVYMLTAMLFARIDHASNLRANHAAVRVAINQKKSSQTVRTLSAFVPPAASGSLTADHLRRSTRHGQLRNRRVQTRSGCSIGARDDARASMRQRHRHPERFAGGDRIPSEFAAAQISTMPKPTCALAAAVPFGYRRRTPQFGQVAFKARVRFSVREIPMSAMGFVPS